MAQSHESVSYIDEQDAEADPEIVARSSKLMTGRLSFCRRLSNITRADSVCRAADACFPSVRDIVS